MSGMLASNKSRVKTRLVHLSALLLQELYMAQHYRTMMPVTYMFVDINHTVNQLHLAVGVSPVIKE